MIIILNGPSSSGKSSVARAFQTEAAQPFLKIGIDDFWRMMPQDCLTGGLRAQEGFEHHFGVDGQEQKICWVANGIFGQQVFCSIPLVVATLATQKINLIVDEVLLGTDQLRRYVHALVGLPVIFVQVTCDLVVLEMREAARGNRPQGLARHQWLEVHQEPRFYDLTIDTTLAEPKILARQLVKFVEQQFPRATSFARLLALWPV